MGSFLYAGWSRLTGVSYRFGSVVVVRWFGMGGVAGLCHMPTCSRSYGLGSDTWHRTAAWW